MPRLRPLRPADVPAVRHLERCCFGRNAGPPAALHALLADPLSAGLVADTTGGLLGYLLYHLDTSAWEVRICQVAVHPEHRRRGVGSRLLGWVARHTPPASGVVLRAGVNEANLAAQLFLRANGFRAVAVHPRAACGGAEDLYLFRFHPGREETPL
jgi:ribosomal-protein-alanine N-acetyltransferase